MSEMGAVMELKKMGLEFSLAKTVSAHLAPGEVGLSEKQRVRMCLAVCRCSARAMSMWV